MVSLRYSKIFMLILLVSMIILSGLLLYVKPWSRGLTLEGVNVILYATPECQCCREYARYLEDLGVKVNIVNVSPEELKSIKSSLGIPEDVWSCHTITIEGYNYFVEGHVPGEAIGKLLLEKPKIRGIALPGMSPGSPGMPGVKRAPLIVYAISSNGSIYVFSTH